MYHYTDHHSMPLRGKLRFNGSAQSMAVVYYLDLLVDSSPRLATDHTASQYSYSDKEKRGCYPHVT